MKREFFVLLGAAVLGSICSALAQNPAVPGAMTNQPTDFSKIFKSDREKNSYAMGMNYGEHLRSTITNQDIDTDMEVLVKGFRDGVTGASTLITQDQEREILTAFSRDLQAKQMEKRRRTAETNKFMSDNWLMRNKSQPGVVALPSGLQYKVLAEGKGSSPQPGDIVTVNYAGKLLNGTEFDSSIKRGKPAEFPVMGVIKGWSEALQLMKPGDKWQLFIPPDLAYGESGYGNNIEPNSALIFEVELVSFKPPPPAPAPSAMSGGTPLTSDIVKVPSAEEMKKGAKIETIKAADIEKEKEKVNK